MRRRTLTELARNPNLISGVYNYCDRWCERCPLSSRCLLYAQDACRLVYVLRPLGFLRLVALAVAMFFTIGKEGAKVPPECVARAWSDRKPVKPFVDLTCCDRADRRSLEIVYKPSQSQSQVIAITVAESPLPS